MLDQLSPHPSFKMEDEYLELHEFMILLLFLLSPMLIFWSVVWVRGGDKSDIKVQREQKFCEIIGNQKKLVSYDSLKGINNTLYLIFLLSTLVISGFSSDYFINEYLVDQVFKYEWGKFQN